MKRSKLFFTAASLVSAMVLSLATPVMASDVTDSSAAAGAEALVGDKDETEESTASDVTAPEEDPAITVSENSVSQNKGPNPFKDVASGKYYSAAVQWAYENNIVNGTSATTFGPMDRITRGQIAVILYNALGKNAEVSGTSPFSDVTSDRYFYKAVIWANQNGIAAGVSSGKFAPSDKTTRAQAISLLWRAYGKEGHETKNPYLDVPSSSYYYNAVLWAYENAYTNGTSQYLFGSSDSLTRGQFVTWLYNISKGNTAKRVETNDAVDTLSTVYNGTDYALVFNYEYYFQHYSNVRARFKGNPEGALAYFVKEGMGVHQRASESFDVMSYYRANQDLRLAFGQDWAKYYNHYITQGYKEPRKTTGVKAITEPITTYKGTDFSAIYDYKYYCAHQSIIQQMFGSREDDKGAIERFVTVGLANGTQAKAGVTSSNAKYQALRQKFHPDSHLAKANSYSSKTGWLMLVDKSEHRVYVYKGSKGAWVKDRSFLCGNGAAATPTPSGVFAVYGRKYYFDSGTTRCFYATMFHGAYYFHSTLYAQTSTPRYVMDDRVGLALSHGCVRLRLTNAKWVYDNIPTGTTVVVY